MFNPTAAILSLSLGAWYPGPPSILLGTNMGKAIAAAPVVRNLLLDISPVDLLPALFSEDFIVFGFKVFK
jgi:hypothetical protein